MDIFFELVGVTAGVLIMMAALPQLLKTHQTRNVEGLSFNTFLIWAMSALCWAVYGAHLGSYQMIFFNTISMLCNLYILYMINKYQKKKLPE